MRFTEWLTRLLVPLRKNARGDGDSSNQFPDDEEEDEIDLFNPFPEPVRLEIRDVFDLHTIAPRDIGRVVEEYLSEAQRAGFRGVRIIHGKGVGVQREAVRKIVARTPFVESWADAPPEAGGWGATVVCFREREN